MAVVLHCQAYQAYQCSLAMQSLPEPEDPGIHFSVIKTDQVDQVESMTQMRSVFKLPPLCPTPLLHTRILASRGTSGICAL